MRVALALALVFAATAPAFADGLVVPLDHSTRIAIRGQAASVVVGNPKVADVTVVDTHTLFVSGRGYGQTDVVVLDREGRTLYKGDVTVAAASAGRVSVYRGSQRADFSCAPGCAASGLAPTSGSGGGDAAGASDGGLGGAVSGVSGAVGSGAGGLAAAGGAFTPG